MKLGGKVICVLAHLRIQDFKIQFMERLLDHSKQLWEIVAAYKKKPNFFKENSLVLPRYF